MILTGTCVPTPGLKQKYGVYAFATGILAPQVLVDPMVRTMRGEQALVAHEMAHVEGRHALKYVMSLIVAGTLGCFCAVAGAAQIAGAASLPAWANISFLAFTIAWAVHIPFFLRWCEVEADKYALARTDSKTFVAFLWLHPHPKGRWGRWLYGSSIEDRINRVLPK